MTEDPVMRLAAAITYLADAIRERGGRGAPPQVVARSMSPEESLAKRLAARLGSSLNPCRHQIKSLRQAGRTVEWLEEKLSEAEPGLAPWDWTRRVTNATAIKDREQAIPPAAVKTMEAAAAELGMTMDEYMDYHGIR